MMLLGFIAGAIVTVFVGMLIFIRVFGKMFGNF